MTDTAMSPLDSAATLIDVDQVAHLLRCSPRHVYRLAHSGSMPRPRYLGALVRWSLSEVEQWVNDGCPVVSQDGGAA
jgi:excisionase family DNA binding protein